MLLPLTTLDYRLKKEMVLRVNTVAAEFRKVSNKQMADTTKRNIRENVSINAQLAKMSEKTKEMIQVPICVVFQMNRCFLSHFEF